MARMARATLQTSVFRGVKAMLRRAGIEIKRRRNELDEENVLKQLFEDVSIDLVVDVGANTGQYAKALRACVYAGPIVSFEPQPDAHAELLASSRSDSAWQIAEPIALGSEPGELQLNIAANSTSSSLLPMLATHEDAAPRSAYVGVRTVRVERLDAVLPPLMGNARSALLKVDTQGYEDRVLAGAERIMHRFAAVQLEISLAQLYAGQARSSDVIGQLGKAGYDLSYIIPGFRHPQTGRLLQFDGLFVRSDS
jgi:FkbM family methyltransferase